MRRQDVQIELALDDTGKRRRQIRVQFISGNTKAQAEAVQDAGRAVIQDGIWMLPAKVVTTPKEFRDGTGDISLIAYCPRRGFHEELYKVGDTMALRLANVLHLLGFLTRQELGVSYKANRHCEIARRFEIEKENALSDLNSALSTLGVEEVLQLAKARLPKKTA